MNYPHVYRGAQQVTTLEVMVAELQQVRADGRVIVATNGCFDLLHAGHVSALELSRSLGDVLVVGLNSDTSVARLKGPGKPLVPERDRAGLIASLRCVDYVVVFDDLDANGWLAQVQPHRYCKSGDYSVHSLPEAAIVAQHGGEIHILPFFPGYSTSDLITRILQTSCDRPVMTADGPGIEHLLGYGNALRQTAYHLADAAMQARVVIADTQRRGGRIHLDHAGVAGDVLIATAPSTDMAAAVQRGLTVIAITAEDAAIPHGVLALTVPTTDPVYLRLARLMLLDFLGASLPETTRVDA